MGPLMAKPPMCKLCGKEHWFSEPHVWPVATPAEDDHQTDHYVPRETFDWSKREKELGLSPLADRLLR